MDLPNPNRINLENPAEVLLWADLLGISVERLHEVVARVGPMAGAVRFYATKTASEAKGDKSAATTPTTPTTSVVEEAVNPSRRTPEAAAPGRSGLAHLASG